MSLLTKDLYTKLCGLSLVEGSAEDCLLELNIDAVNGQIISAIGENPCIQDENGDDIIKMYSASECDWSYDCKKCIYTITLPIPVTRIVSIAGDLPDHKFDGCTLYVKSSKCLQDCFCLINIEYVGGWDNTSDLQLLSKMMIDARGALKDGLTVRSIKAGCETITFCCEDTSATKSLVEGIQAKYFSSDVTCVV